MPDSRLQAMKSKVALLTKSIRRQRELSEKTKETLADPANPPPVVLWPMYPSDTLHILTLYGGPIHYRNLSTKLQPSDAVPAVVVSSTCSFLRPGVPPPSPGC